MKLVKVVVTGLFVGAVAAFVAALLKPRRTPPADTYDPWQPPVADPAATG
jgi:hypothetical protein